MPNIKAAVKHLRQTKRRTARNNKVRSAIDIAIRTARKSLAAKASDAGAKVKEAVKTLDKAAQKGVIKAGNAARRKSRLMLALKKLKP